MPGTSGDALCRTIKADPELSATPVILVTGPDAPEDHALAIRAGADDVLAKPLSRVTLIHAVNRFLRSPVLRGLARVGLETAVRIRLPDEDAWGTARNLSRGGIFVELEHAISPRTEVELEFRLPDAAGAARPDRPGGVAPPGSAGRADGPRPPVPGPRRRERPADRGLRLRAPARRGRSRRSPSPRMEAR